MSFLFKQFSNVPELLVGQKNKGDRGWVAVVLSPGKQAPGGSLTLVEALTEQGLKEPLYASFVFSTYDPPLENEDDAHSLVSLVQNSLNGRGAKRGIVWLQKNVLLGNSSSLPSLGFSLPADRVNYALSMVLGTGVQIEIDNGMVLSLDEPEETLRFKNSPGGTYHIHFEGPAAPTFTADNGAIAFSGSDRGCIKFDIAITQGFLHNEWFWGFQFQVPGLGKDKHGDDNVVAQWMPFADKGTAKSNSIPIDFSCVFDPGDVFNQTLDRRTILKFNGSTSNAESQKIQLTSNYRTSTGAQVQLNPITLDQLESSDLVAGFAFSKGKNLGKDNLNLYVTPVGDFIVSAPTAPASKQTQLLCGLKGNEYLALTPQSNGYAGDRLRFVGSMPSYGYCYPLPQASPVGPPVDLSKPLLDNTFTTSWATSVTAQGAKNNPTYVAQPKGSPLYGQDPVVYQNQKSLLGAMHPGTEISDASCFPMPPYAGISINDDSSTFDSKLTGLFESRFLSPTRREKIGTGKPVFSEMGHLPLMATNASTYNVTTPTGQLVTLDDSGMWSNILLAQLIHPVNSQLYFENPTPKLKQAFQTADPMLVIANPKYLGTMTNDIESSSGEAAFCNALNIEEWVLAASVGTACSYGDYANIIIVKGVKGKLFDPDQDPQDNLIANPAQWTQKEDFAGPNGKNDEQVALSQWMVEYFKDAAEKGKSDIDRLYFERFNQIARDENWSGILVLRAQIAKLPVQMQGITAGIEDPSTFFAHHLAIETGQVVNDDDLGIRLKDSTSVYGLIFYNDPEYDETKPDQPVSSDPGTDFDFRLLTLKVLFENSALKHFQSYAQLTLNQLYGSKVTAMGDGGNPYNSMILRGTFQDNGGTPIYGMGSLRDYTFFVESNVFNKIEITSAQMTNREATDTDSDIWFGMTGYLDFVSLVKTVEKTAKKKSDTQSKDAEDTANTPYIIDVFSFGSKDGKIPRSGLHFSNLGLEMKYPTKNPTKRTFVFNTNEFRFDVASSTIRDGSLYRSFALELEGLISGSGDDNTPQKKGFLSVVTDLRLSGVGSKDWYGLKFRLNLGTPGELAGKIGLNADLLLAWSADGSSGEDYQIEVGLHLPGVTGDANLISLQNVLKLSFGPIRLLYVKDPNTQNAGEELPRRFMLLLTDIALKFLGLLKIPPGGSTMFYLFGNPKSEGKASGLGWYARYPGSN